MSLVRLVPALCRLRGFRASVRTERVLLSAAIEDAVARRGPGWGDLQIHTVSLSPSKHVLLSQ